MFLLFILIVKQPRFARYLNNKGSSEFQYGRCEMYNLCDLYASGAELVHLLILCVGLMIAGIFYLSVLVRGDLHRESRDFHT